jgi:hypothetical protein
MYVTQHARERIAERLGPEAPALVDILSSYDGEAGTVAYLMLNRNLFSMEPKRQVLVAIAVDGSVDTIYWRRATQDLSPEFFGARKVIDMRAEPLRRKAGAR